MNHDHAKTQKIEKKLDTGIVEYKIIIKKKFQEIDE